jgi:myosin I
MLQGEGDDLTILQDVSPQAIAEVLERRFKQDRIYASVGPVLVAMNPYKQIRTAGLETIYDDKVAYHYFAHSALELGPHIYRIASEAYKDLRARNESQCVIITGEVRGHRVRAPRGTG